MLTSPSQLGSSPLYFAAQENYVPVAEVLIKHGAKVDLARDVSQCLCNFCRSIHVHCTSILAHVQQGIEEECCLLVQIYNFSCCAVDERALMLVEIHREILNHYARVCPARS